VAITVQELVGAFSEFERPMLRTRPGWKTQPRRAHRRTPTEYAK
jgi:hypothetical protein